MICEALMLAALLHHPSFEIDDEDAVQQLMKQKARPARGRAAWQAFLQAARECKDKRSEADRMEADASNLRNEAKEATRRMNRQPSDLKLASAADKANAKFREADALAKPAIAAKMAAIAQLKRAEDDLKGFGLSVRNPPVQPRFVCMINGEEILASQLAETSTRVVLKDMDGHKIVAGRAWVMFVRPVEQGD